VVPLAIIDLLQQIQVAIQHLNGKEVHFEDLGTFRILLLLLWLAMAEEEEPVWLCGTEDDERLGCLKSNGVQSGHILTLEGHSTM
uniref:Uncharacterized protein n=1 Tax=Hippocampus comes TaxID=109280 RepID=A0A3Q2YYA0_HIPCM